MNLLAIGDSVCWGQGLLPEHKFGNLVAKKLAAGLESRAHSGAVIGAGADQPNGPQPGEVPVSLPTIRHQLGSYPDIADVDIVLANGGINDIGVGRILSPWTTQAQVETWTQQHCGRDMTELLTEIGNELRKPGAKVAVIGYYPILSSDSTHFADRMQAQVFLEMHGVATGSASLKVSFDTDLLLSPAIRNCLEFWHRSDQELNGAVAAANQYFKGAPQFIFVQLPFQEENAVFASHPLLWGLTPLLSAEDEVREEREPACDAAFGDLVGLPKLIQCYRASAGHPNVEGAAVIADAILAGLR